MTTKEPKEFLKESHSDPMKVYSDATFENVSEMMETMFAEPEKDEKEDKEFGEENEVHKMMPNRENDGGMPPSTEDGICLRKGCCKPGVENIEWDGEYCSNECVVMHCQDVFKEWREEELNPGESVCQVCSLKEEEEELDGVKEKEFVEDSKFYCSTCYPVKLMEFESLKEKLLVRVKELAEAQVDFGGATISRELFKDKRNAGEYNFRSKHPATLRELASRITTNFKTFREFKCEARLWVQRLRELLLEKCENDLQYIEWEIRDYVEDLLKEDDRSDEDVQFEINQDTSMQ